MLGCNESIWLVVKSSVTFKPLGQCGKDGGGEPSKPPRTLVLGPISVYILLLHFLQQACNVSRTLEHFFFFIAILTLFFYNNLRFWSDVKPIKKLTPTVKRKKKNLHALNVNAISVEWGRSSFLNCATFIPVFSKYQCFYSCSQELGVYPGKLRILQQQAESRPGTFLPGH